MLDVRPPVVAQPTCVASFSDIRQPRVLQSGRLSLDLTEEAGCESGISSCTNNSTFLLSLSLHDLKKN